MNHQNFFSVVRSEWIKFRTLGSNIRGTLATLALTLGFGILITAAVRSRHETGASHRIIDPVATALAGLFFAQFAMGVMGSRFFTDEYSSGAIRTSLAAVPHRIRLVLAKLSVLLGYSIVLGEVASFAAFFIGQAIYKGSPVHAVALGDAGVSRAVIMSGVYLALMTVVGMGLGLIFRTQAITITTFVTVLLVLPLITLALPSNWQNHIDKYLPSNLGQAMRATTQDPTLFHPVAAFVWLVIYSALIVIVGTALFVRRNA